MALWIEAGTVAVTNGSAGVTGTGTTWDVNTVLPGYGFRGPDGQLYEILQVISATQLTLAQNYGGANNATGSYRIIQIPFAASRDIVEKLQALVSAWKSSVSLAGTLAVGAPTVSTAVAAFKGTLVSLENAGSTALQIVKALITDTAYLNFLTGSTQKARIGLDNTDTLVVDAVNSAAFKQALILDTVANPSAPVNGMMWKDTTSGLINVRQGGVTSILGGGGSPYNTDQVFNAAISARGSVLFEEVPLAITANVATPNMQDGPDYSITITGALGITIANPTNAPAAPNWAKGLIRILNTSGGTRALTWGANYGSPMGALPSSIGNGQTILCDYSCAGSTVILEVEGNVVPGLTTTFTAQQNFNAGANFTGPVGSTESAAPMASNVFTPNFAQGPDHLISHAAAANFTIASPINIPATTTKGVLRINNTSGAVRTITWGGAYAVFSGVLPASIASGANTVLNYWTFGSVVYIFSNASSVPDALSTASGSAPSYSLRGWVNFNGTGTVAIRASGNTSSITDNGVGDYTWNFTTALPNVDYGVIGMCNSYQSAFATGDVCVATSSSSAAPTTKTTSAVRVITAGDSGLVAIEDRSEIYLAAMR
jgi:hypothetical protein